MAVTCLASLATSFPVATTAAPALTPTPALTVTTLTPRVSVLSGGPDGNILVLHGEAEALIVDGQALASGAGTNRKRAEQAAAQEALSGLHEPENSDDGS